MGSLTPLAWGRPLGSPDRDRLAAPSRVPPSFSDSPHDPDLPLSRVKDPPMTVSRLGDRSIGSAVIRGGRRLREGNWWASVAGGVIAFPIAVVPHELGHYGA